MSYKLREHEGLSDGTKRIVLEQIDKALDHLKPTVRNKDEAIHDARVCIKKIRALLRLIRESLGDETYKAEDSNYRDAARMLSKVRDSAAMLEIVDKLIEHFSDQLSTDAFGGVRASLLRFQEDAATRSKERNDKGRTVITSSAGTRAGLARGRPLPSARERPKTSL